MSLGIECQYAWTWIFSHLFVALVMVMIGYMLGRRENRHKRK